MNNSKNQWLLEQIQQQLHTEPQYEKRAFWQGLKTVVEQQQDRIQQLQAEIDGHLWNHEQW
ncbi:hypothetical protein [Bombilactobacillus bombi]|uniref:hypothetical protein n=1 Tax=Bombilactobacillus bombi TaxID=1303590 RepID=UPI0015E5A804|nr:hypothetical protein [Bombilactobacillus bombi]MBA1435156.1 hypothetical protein [Bombilactobacillus bombi]